MSLLLALQGGVGNVTLTVADLSVAVTAENPDLVQANLLAVADVAVAVTAESPSLIEAALLTVADASVAVNAESPVLIEAAILTVQDVLVATSADDVVLVFEEAAEEEAPYEGATASVGSDGGYLIHYQVEELPPARPAPFRLTVHAVSVAVAVDHVVLFGESQDPDEPYQDEDDAIAALLYDLVVHEFA